MARQAPNPVDVQDFQFKLHCRLKLFANEDSTGFNKPCNLVASASRFGLIFVGTPSPTFQVIQTSSIEKHTPKDGEVTNYNRRIIPLPSPPKHLTVNCDSTKLAVVVEKNGCSIGLIYDVPSVMKQVVSVPTEIRLTPTPGVSITETSWNPTIPNIYTACKDDGTLGLYELKESGIDINELPAESQATCMCWSPKGKQIAVGSRNGKITQYKPDLKAMKVINAPPLEGTHTVVSLQWISNYQFIALYKPHSGDNGASLLVVDAPKSGETVYTNYEDICYSYGNTRPTQFYTVFQSIWNILMVASSNSMEVGVLGIEAEQWTQWILADAARAELPLSASKQETMPIGLAFDTAAVEPVVWGETSLPPAPFLLVLSHHGLLCCFRVVNIKSGVVTLCQAPEPLVDTSGLSQFTTASAVTTSEVPMPETPKQTSAAATPLSKPTPAVSQAPFPSLAQTYAPPTPTLPQVPLFTSAPTSLFTTQPSFLTAKPESTSVPKPDPPFPSLFPAKTLPQNLFDTPIQQQQPTFTSAAITPPVLKTSQLSTPASTAPVSVVVPSIPVSPVVTSETSIAQEEADILIAKLIREECETLEAELQALLHKGRALKIELGTDTEAVELVHGTDTLHDFLKDVTDTSAAQGAEVHSLKQGLIQTWAWYEDARSRFAQTQDAALEALLRIQQLDPVSQRYLADIQHMTYYMESQLAQASRALDEQWEAFQDSCKKVIKLKVPTMETIYQTMVRQSAIHQKQKYVLKDISNRIRAHRSKINGPSLLVSLNSADQLEKELHRLQLEPQYLLQAQYQRVFQNQQKLTPSKVQKLSKLLLDRDIMHVAVSKPQLSSTALQSLIQSSSNLSAQNKISETSQLLGAALSPIFANKPVAPRSIDFIQSTPKTASSSVDATVKQNYMSATVGTSEADVLKGLPPGISVKFTLGAPTGFGNVSASSTTATTTKSELSSTMVTVPSQLKFAAIPNTLVFTAGTSSLNTHTSTVPTSTSQLNFNLSQGGAGIKTNSASVTFMAPPVSQPKPSSDTSQANQYSTSMGTSRPSAPFGSLFSSTKPNTSTFSFSLTTAATTSTVSSQPTTIKPLAGISAFVPTTQLGFSFSTKGSISAPTPTPSPTPGTPSKSSAFVFSTSASAFGSTNTVTIKPIMLTDSAVAATSSSFVPSTTAVIVVPSVTSSALSAKSSAVDTVPTTAVHAVVTTPVCSSLQASSVETSSGSAPSQGLQTPKTVTPVVTVLPTAAIAVPVVSNVNTTASATTPSLEVTASLPLNLTSTDKKVISGAPSVSSSQVPALGTTSTAAPQSSLFSFTLPTTKVNESPLAQPVSSIPKESIFGTPASATTTATKTSEAVAQPSIFAKATPSSGSVFGTAGVYTTTASIFGSPATATSASSIFGTPIAATMAVSVFGTPGTSNTTAILTTPTTTTTSGSLFSAPTTTAMSGSLFGTPATASGSIFGTLVAPPLPSGTAAGLTSVFNATVATTTAATTTAAALYGTPAVTTASATGFSAPVTTAASPFALPSTLASPIFGGTPASTSASVFGAAGFGTSSSTTTPSVFAQAASTAPSLFATPTNPIFGVPPKTTAGGPFGTSAFASTSGSMFGQPASFGGSVFGAPASTSTNTFGNAGGSMFRAPSTAPNAFGQSQTSTFSFAAAAANVPSTNATFGFSKQSAFGFGATPASTDSGSFSFGSLNMGTAATTANAPFSSGFGGQPPNPNPFAKAVPQEQKPAFGGGSLFGTPATTSSTSVFGSGSTSTFGSPSQAFGSPAAFGSSSSFGQQPVFGQAAFGNSFGSPSQPGPFSGGNQSVAQSGFGAFDQAQKAAGFGAAPVFGGSPTGFGSPFGGGNPAFGAAASFGSPSKVFGGSSSPTGAFGATAQQQSPTFANLATQNTLGFGALAQQSQAAPSSSPFSGFSVNDPNLW